MKNKSDENFNCAKLASKARYYSAAMSRCYYSMFQMALHYFEMLVMNNELDRKDYERKRERHGEIQHLLHDHGIRGLENEDFGTVMYFRKIADYKPDEIFPQTLNHCIEKAKNFRLKIEKCMGRKT